MTADHCVMLTYTRFAMLCHLELEAKTLDIDVIGLLLYCVVKDALDHPTSFPKVRRMSALISKLNDNA